MSLSKKRVTHLPLGTKKPNILLEAHVKHCPVCTRLGYQCHLLGGVEVEDSEADAQNTFSLSLSGLTPPKFTVELNRNTVQMLGKRHRLLASAA